MNKNNIILEALKILKQLEDHPDDVCILKLCTDFSGEIFLPGNFTDIEDYRFDNLADLKNLFPELKNQINREEA